MPIEFICGGCGTRLRVPDQTVGQFASCPTCEKHTLVRNAPEFRFVADGDTTGAAGPPPLPTAPPTWTEAAPHDNPYAASEPSPAARDRHPGDEGSTLELHYQPIELGGLLNDAWGLFRRNLGRSLLLGLAVMGVSWITNAVQAGALSVVASPDPASLAVLPFGLAQFVINTLLMAIPTWFALRWAREREMAGQVIPGPANSPPPLDAMALWRVFAGRIVVVLIVSAVVVLAMVPIALVLVGVFGVSSTGAPAAASLILVPAFLIGFGIFVRFYLRYLLVDHFILDRGCGIFEAIQQSRTFTRGNVLPIFLSLLLLGIATMVFSLVTLGLGILVAPALFACLQIAIYLRSTGQPIPRLDSES